MPEYDNKNRGAIWKNDRKTTETQPDYTGTINIEGVDYWLNGWRAAEGASDRAPVLKFSVAPKEAPKPIPAAENNEQSNSGFDDDIPF
jgi:hypothetical protein|tara:strand:+ start:160 stop:423 length:264 start_codon:yes stop_codon:yes gene_type:complete